ncbi:MAG: twitching motility protein PilT [Dehalococcoidia bacterium]|nr:twitching motility protein PilT [Dehalococcoidia bacterium]
MTALVLDAGAFVAIERNDRSTIARLQAAEFDSIRLRTSAIVLAQVWRNPIDRQANLARLFRGVDIQPVTERLGRDAGVLLGLARMSDAVDATVVLVAEDGDSILTSDPADIARLVTAAGRHVSIIPC